MKLRCLVIPTAILVTAFCCAGRAGVVTQIEFLGKHPDAVLQPTAVGTTLHTLHAAGGDVYMGYGDFNVNTGPISMRSFDTQNDTFSPALISVNTEAIHRIRVIGNEVWATTTDPLLFTDGGYVKGPVGGGTWSAVNSLATLHLFDIASYAGDANHLFLSGSGGPSSTNNSIVYETQDGGANWNLVLDVPVPNGAVGFTRFYGIGELNNRLYIQNSLLGIGIAPIEMYNYDGNTWSTQPTPTTPSGQKIRFIDPDTFAGKIVVRGEHSGLAAQPTYIFDGTALAEIQVTGNSGLLKYWDQYVDGNTLYLLTDELTVIATQDLQNWSVIATDLPSTVRSLAVTGGAIYLGASDSSLYRTAVPEPPATYMLLTVLLGLIVANSRAALTRIGDRAGLGWRRIYASTPRTE
jgi:hypothetical protein